MSTLVQFLTEPRPVSLEDVLDSAMTAPSVLGPFAPELLQFFSAVSERLLAAPEARRFPDLVALGYWLRPSELNRMREAFEARLPPHTIAVPRGLVFHIPPANVDTMFVYSWALSALVGNRNLIRLSPRSNSPQVTVLLSILGELLAQPAYQAIAEATRVVGYGHDEAINQALSAACDMRVLWGGDATIAALRRFPLAAHAKELAFPDRFSAAVIRAEAYRSCSEAEERRLVENFYNDAYLFSQMGCASPRLVYWCGPQALCDEASERFFMRLQDEIDRREFEVETGTALKKLLYAHRQILDRPVSAYRAPSNALSVLTLSEPTDVRAETCGGGMFFQTRLESLTDLLAWTRRRDQTLTHFGFGQEELASLVVALNGRGVDRLVPVGQALNFQRVWDGYDLLGELSRLVVVQA